MNARILCLIVLLLEIRGLSISLSKRKWYALAFYTQLSNLVTAFSALCLVLLGQLPWITVLRYLSTCMLIMTFLVTTCILVPMGGGAKALLWSGNGLYHHVLCPILSTASYLFAENHASREWMLLPIMVTLIYGLVMLLLNGFRKVDGPYPFFRVHNLSVLTTVVWMIALLAAITLFSFLVLIAA